MMEMKSWKKFGFLFDGFNVPLNVVRSKVSRLLYNCHNFEILNILNSWIMRDYIQSVNFKTQKLKIIQLVILTILKIFKLLHLMNHKTLETWNIIQYAQLGILKSWNLERKFWTFWTFWNIDHLENLELPIKPNN